MDQTALMEKNNKKKKQTPTVITLLSTQTTVMTISCETVVYSLVRAVCLPNTHKC